MKLSKLASAALICAFFFSSLNRADELTLDKLAAQFSKINKPDKASSAFEHWKYNTFAQTILFCWGIEKSKKKMPEVLSKYSPTAAGSFSLPALKDKGKFCKSLAEKPLAPFCTAGTFWAKDVKRRNDLPLDYVQVSKKKELKIEGSLKCFLNKDQMNEQPYIGPLTAEWAVPSKSQSINTPSGPKTLEVGTVMIKAPGVLNFNQQPFSEIRMAVVIE
jgi:hypothetical protein